MTQNELQLNTEKTETMLIGTRQKLSSISVNTFQLENSTVSLSDPVKSLGVLLDSTLCMDNFISQTTKSCYYQLRRISSVQKHLSTEATGKFCHALTTAILSFLACLLPPSKAFVAYRTVLLASYGKQQQQNVKLTTSHLCFNFSTSFQSNKEFSTR